MIVVCDTSPICYLLLIERIELLRQLYGRAIIPQAVNKELGASQSPAIVRNWISSPPDWLEIRSVASLADETLQTLHQGEREVILLAESLKVPLVVLDEKEGRRVARTRGLKVIGLLGILDSAAKLGLLDFQEAIGRLQETTFWAAPSLIQFLLAQHQNDR